MSTCVRGGITYKRHTFANEVCTKCGRSQFLDLDKDDAYEVVPDTTTDDESWYGPEPIDSNDEAEASDSSIFDNE